MYKENEKVILAVSGGPDSIAMLNIFYNIYGNKNIVVAHINHQIREEANLDEEYVKQFCKKRKIRFFSKKVEVKEISKKNKIGLEETGRMVRYKFFEQIKTKVEANKIAIAHNKNDKVETIIMNILRGAGTQGIIGIEAIREQYIRPLIECSREEIENYCKENNLEPRIDKTNFDNIYTRNKIRNIVIPYMKKEFNPNIIETLIRLSEIVTEEENFINKNVKKTFEEILIAQKNKEIILDLKKFNQKEKVIQSKIIIYTIKELLGNAKGIEKVHIQDILKLCNNNIGNKFLSPKKGIKILIKKQQIIFINQT